MKKVIQRGNVMKPLNERKILEEIIFDIINSQVRGFLWTTTAIRNSLGSKLNLSSYSSRNDRLKASIVDSILEGFVRRGYMEDKKSLSEHSSRFVRVFYLKEI